jgi:hypothetical protein
MLACVAIVGRSENVKAAEAGGLVPIVRNLAVPSEVAASLLWLKELGKRIQGYKLGNFC